MLALLCVWQDSRLCLLSVWCKLLIPLSCLCPISRCLIGSVLLFALRWSTTSIVCIRWLMSRVFVTVGVINNNCGIWSCYESSAPSCSGCICVILQMSFFIILGVVLWYFCLFPIKGFFLNPGHRSAIFLVSDLSPMNPVKLTSSASALSLLLGNLPSAALLSSVPTPSPHIQITNGNTVNLRCV